MRSWQRIQEAVLTHTVQVQSISIPVQINSAKPTLQQLLVDRKGLKGAWGVHLHQNAQKG